MPQPHVRDAALAEIKKLPGFPKLRIADLSCGEGELLACLKGYGCSVTGTQYRSDDYIVKNEDQLKALTIVPHIDLEKQLPFPSESFDVVILTEVIEHLDGPKQVITEAGRILRKNGTLIISMPNTMRIASRILYLFTGKQGLKRRRMGWDCTLDDLYKYHTSPIDLSYLLTLLNIAGFKCVNTKTTKMRLWAYLLFPIVPIIWLACFLTIDREAHSNPDFMSSENKLNRLLSQPSTLFSEQMFFVCRK